MLDAGPGGQGQRWGSPGAREPSVATTLVVPRRAPKATAALLPEQGETRPRGEHGAIAAGAAPADPELSAAVWCWCLKAWRTRRHLSSAVLVCGCSAAHQLGDVGLRVAGYASARCFAAW